MTNEERAIKPALIGWLIAAAVIALVWILKYGLF